jgi:hypothetical protein
MAVVVMVMTLLLMMLLLELLLLLQLIELIVVIGVRAVMIVSMPPTVIVLTSMAGICAGSPRMSAMGQNAKNSG